MGVAASLSHRRREAAGVGTGLAVGEAWGLDGSVELRWAGSVGWPLGWFNG